MQDSPEHTDTRSAVETSDELLLERFLQGDDASFTELYERYDRKVLTYLRTILRDCPEVADDLFQETFVRLFRERKRKLAAEEEETHYHAIRNFRGWLFRVAHNLAISHLRKNRKTVSLSDEEVEPGGWDERLMVPIEESFAQFYGETSLLENQDVYKYFRQCVRLLPGSLKEVFILREIAGMEYEDVAETIGCTPEAARMRISRARKALRKALEQFVGSDE